jgi:hypothetical protein
MMLTHVVNHFAVHLGEVNRKKRQSVGDINCTVFISKFVRNPLEKALDDSAPETYDTRLNPALARYMPHGFDW